VTVLRSFLLKVLTWFSVTMDLAYMLLADLDDDDNNSDRNCRSTINTSMQQQQHIQQQFWIVWS